ncbi:MAG TPA: NAD(P)/FAD-dependent oxidoreductase [Thermoanaerobaculia bacterium]|nr:NAD(P)/FAD-dependent oxidoreductase [Thermoanaerobaculia bacterium]
MAIIGGGPAGAAAALMLARAGRRVLLADQTPGDLDFKIGEGLPPAARPLLRDLGALEPFLDDGHLPSFGNESSWGSGTPRIHDFIRDPNGHGWHLDRVRFDAMLRRLAQEAGAELWAPARLRGFSREAGGAWRLSIGPAEKEQETRAGWLVDATGRAAYVARQLGAKTAYDDRQVAFTALFAPRPGEPEDHDSLTRVESAPDGWWYTALLPGKRRVVAFLTDADLEAARAAAQPAGFDELLAQTHNVRSRLATGGYRRLAAPRGGPAASARLIPGHGDGWVAIGDAALAFDPLSSQGILTALYGGLRAARSIESELAGTRGSVKGFSEDLHRVHEAYRRNRLAIYAEEKRWAERDFWRRRNGGSAAPPETPA